MLSLQDILTKTVSTLKNSVAFLKLITIRELLEHEIDANEEMWWNGAVSGRALAGTALDQMLANFSLKDIEPKVNLSRDDAYNWLHVAAGNKDEEQLQRLLGSFGSFDHCATEFDQMKKRRDSVKIGGPISKMWSPENIRRDRGSTDAAV